jgi:hypothetical protein
MIKFRSKTAQYKLLSRFCYGTSAGIAVEFVLILPLVLILLVAALDFGSYFLKKQNLASINRGIITIVSNSTSFSIDQATLLNYAQNSLGQSVQNIALSVNQECRCLDAVTGCQTNCEGKPPALFIVSNLSYSHPLLFSYPGVGRSLPVANSLAFRTR